MVGLPQQIAEATLERELDALSRREEVNQAQCKSGGVDRLSDYKLATVEYACLRAHNLLPY
eukprot:5291005-Amphidinium_carterae.2